MEKEEVEKTKEELKKIKEYVDKYRESCPKLNLKWKDTYETRQDACDAAFNCIYEASNIVKDPHFKTIFECMIVPCGDRTCGTASIKFTGLEKRLKELEKAEEK